MRRGRGGERGKKESEEGKGEGRGKGVVREREGKRMVKGRARGGEGVGSRSQSRSQLTPRPPAARPGVTERTFVAIKPDGVQRQLVGEIIRRFERKGFRLLGLKLLQVSAAPVPRGVPRSPRVLTVGSPCPGLGGAAEGALRGPAGPTLLRAAGEVHELGARGRDGECWRMEPC